MGKGTNNKADRRKYNSSKPKFDYDGDAFFEAIKKYASSGLTDREIARLGLLQEFGESLDDDTFSQMKNGTYPGWSEAQNKERSERILIALAQGRTAIVAQLRGKYIQLALGKIVTRNRTIKKLRINGEETDGEEMSILEIEHPPSLQALSTMLNHYDPEFRAKEQGVADGDSAIRGMCIREWLELNDSNTTNE